MDGVWVHAVAEQELLHRVRCAEQRVVKHLEEDRRMAKLSSRWLKVGAALTALRRTPVGTESTPKRT